MDRTLLAALADDLGGTLDDAGVRVDGARVYVGTDGYVKAHRYGAVVVRLGHSDDPVTELAEAFREVIA